MQPPTARIDQSELRLAPRLRRVLSCRHRCLGALAHAGAAGRAVHVAAGDTELGFADWLSGRRTARWLRCRKGDATMRRAVIGSVAVLSIVAIGLYGYTKGWHLSEEELRNRTMDDCIRLITGMSLSEFLQSTGTPLVDAAVLDGLPDTCIALTGQNEFYRTAFELATGFESRGSRHSEPADERVPVIPDPWSAGPPAP